MASHHQPGKAAAGGPNTSTIAGSELWVDKYKPTSVSTMCYPAMAHKLRDWLSAFNPSKIPDQKRGVLLYGPPGVGKTTTVHVVCKELSMDVVEFNASDHRSKRTLHESVSSLVRNHTLTAQGQHNMRKTVLLMDEVDGCDRGGVTEIIALLKTTLIPILCTCNDRWHPKLRSFVSHIEEMRFTRPPYNRIAEYITDRVLKREGAAVPKPILEDVIKQAGNDIRSVLGNLQMWCLTQKHLNEREVSALARRSVKNETYGVFDAAEAFFLPQSPPKTFQEMQAIYYAADLVDLFVQENYIHWRPLPTKGDWMAQVAKSADAISLSDRVSQAMYVEQSWSLSNTHMLLSAYYPSRCVQGKYESFLPPGPAQFHDRGRPIKFPQWLGSNSTTGKHRRLLMCVAKEGTHVDHGFSGNATDVVADYLPLAIAPSMSLPMAEQDKQGIPAVMETMDSYHLTRDDWEWVQEVVRYKKMKHPPSKHYYLDRIPTAVKSAFTREYNKTHQKESVAKAALKSVAAEVLGREPDEEDDDDVDGLTAEEKEKKEIMATLGAKAKAKPPPKGKGKTAKKGDTDGAPKPKPKGKAGAKRARGSE